MLFHRMFCLYLNRTPVGIIVKFIEKQFGSRSIQRLINRNSWSDIQFSYHHPCGSVPQSAFSLSVHRERLTLVIHFTRVAERGKNCLKFAFCLTYFLPLRMRQDMYERGRRWNKQSFSKLNATAATGNCSVGLYFFIFFVRRASLFVVLTRQTASIKWQDCEKRENVRP